MTDEAQWIRETFDIVKNDGIWVVPRSGLTFKKNIQGEDSLTLVLRSPAPYDDTPYEPKLWAGYQQADYEIIAGHARDAGIDVLDLTDGVITDAGV